MRGRPYVYHDYRTILHHLFIECQVIPSGEKLKTEAFIHLALLPHSGKGNQSKLQFGVNDNSMLKVTGCNRAILGKINFL